MTDDAGAVQFKTIFPGWYPMRAVHIHFKIRQMIDGKTSEFTSQFFFRQKDIEPMYAQAPYSATLGKRDTNNATDGTYNGRLADGSKVGDQMLLDLAKNPAGGEYTALFPLILTDAAMENSGRGSRGRRGGPTTARG
jgi:protocatechuate 3,4-dioxygenase beta subunit